MSSNAFGLSAMRPSTSAPAASLEWRQRQCKQLLALAVAGPMRSNARCAGFGTSITNWAGPAAARVRTASTSARVAAVLLATTRTRAR